MKMARSYESFLKGRFVSEGIRMTAGIILPAITLGTFGFLNHGIVMSLGALCVSSTDSPGPIHHRRNAMGICCLLIFLVSLIIGDVTDNTMLLASCIIIFSFIFSMLSVYGARITSLGIAGMLIMVLNMEHNLQGIQIVLNALYVLAGGIFYLVFSLILYRLRPYKIIQQVLGDVIESTADYLIVRSSLYKRNADYHKIAVQLMNKQAVVQEKQSLLSELLFSTRKLVKESTNTGRILVMIFLEVTELFERIMTSYQQYDELHTYFDDTEVLEELRFAVLHLAEELNEIGLAIKSGKNAFPNASTDSILQKAQNSYEDLRKTFMHAENLNGFLALGRILESIQDLGARLKVLYHYTSYDRKIKWKTNELVSSDFIVKQEINVGLFFDSLQFKSNIFRHSLRVSIALLFGFIISIIFKLGHGYWILLTIIVILKPAYSLTKNRNRDRIIGTIAGIIIGVTILYFITNNFILLSILFVFMTFSYIFLRTNYLLSVLLMTPYLLIFFHLIQPLVFKQVLWDRFIDTCIGSTIAFLANLFIVPAWENASMNLYMNRMIEANLKYYEIISEEYINTVPKFVKKFEAVRKDVYIALANLSDAFNRMLSEPKKQQLSPNKMHQFVVLNHTLTSHIATLSYFLKRNTEVYKSESFSPVIIETSGLLEKAREVLNTNIKIRNEIAINKNALIEINEEAQRLLDIRKDEVQHGKYETDTKINLIKVKPIVDQFNYIHTLCFDILKVTSQIKNDT